MLLNPCYNRDYVEIITAEPFSPPASYLINSPSVQWMLPKMMIKSRFPDINYSFCGAIRYEVKVDGVIVGAESKPVSYKTDSNWINISLQGVWEEQAKEL